MIGGLIFREGEDHPDMRLFLVPVSQVKQDACSDDWPTQLFAPESQLLGSALTLQL
jgi:hypothetical protein